MTWLMRQQLRHYWRDSIWIGPTLAIIAALVVVVPFSRFEQYMQWPGESDLAAAQLVLGTLAAAMFTLIVFVSSALLLAVQLASAQLSPRIIGFLFRNRVIKVALSLFCFTFTFTLAVLARFNGPGRPLTGRLAAYGCLLSLFGFLYLINHMGRMLRVSGALRAIGAKGRRVIEKVYPLRFKDQPQAPQREPPAAAPTQTIVSLTDGSVLEFDNRGLVGLAQRFDCIIEVVPQVGDFVAEGDALFRVYRDTPGISVPDRALRHSIAIGPERTAEQDPALTFRIIVDIAAKALSPAINDPTTAVLALDELHHLLRAVGTRHLDERVAVDSLRNVRLMYHTPGWDDFVRLGITEIRQYGGESIQIARRMRALLEDLIRALPPARALPLERELAMLNRSAERFFTEPEDRILAQVGDSQGVGGRHPSGGAKH